MKTEEWRGKHINPCPFCSEENQLQVIEIDHTNSERDLIKCRKCRGEAPRKYWDMALRKPSPEQMAEWIEECMGLIRLVIPKDACDYFKKDLANYLCEKMSNQSTKKGER